MLVKVGLDFSFSSASFCIKNNDSYKWIVIMKDKAGKKSFNYQIRNKLKNTEVKIYVIPNSGQRGNQSKDKEWFEGKVKWCKKVIKILENNIYWFSGGISEYELNIEDTSYSKQTNNVIDISTVMALFKNEFLKSNYCLNWNMYSPSKVKNNIGAKGNASKLDVLKTFQELENDLPIKRSNFWNFVKELSILKDKDIQHHKPIDDCIDAYSLVEF